MLRDTAPRHLHDRELRQRHRRHDEGHLIQRFLQMMISQAILGPDATSSVEYRWVPGLLREWLWLWLWLCFGLRPEDFNFNTSALLLAAPPTCNRVHAQSYTIAILTTQCWWHQCQPHRPDLRNGRMQLLADHRKQQMSFEQQYWLQHPRQPNQSLTTCHVWKRHQHRLDTLPEVGNPRRKPSRLASRNPRRDL